MQQFATVNPDVRYDPGANIDPLVAEERSEQRMFRDNQYQKQLKNLKTHLKIDAKAFKLNATTRENDFNDFNEFNESHSTALPFRKGSLPHLIQNLQQKISMDQFIKNEFSTLERVGHWDRAVM